MIAIERIDHFVLTVRSLEASCRFYEQVLGFERVDTPGKPTAVRFGNQKINLHDWGHEFKPHAHVPVPGSLDLCFIAAQPLEAVIARLNAASVRIVEGPVRKTGAQGPIRSVYVRDPDLNLIEISVYE